MSTYLLDEPIPNTEIIEVEPVAVVVCRFSNYPMSELQAAFDGTFQMLITELSARGITPTGPALAIYHEVPTDTITFDIGIPVDGPLDADVPGDAGFTLSNGTLPAGTVARRTHIGGYGELGRAWEEFVSSIEASSPAGHRPAFPYWEVYVTEPGPDTDQTTLRTDLYTAVAD